MSALLFVFSLVLGAIIFVKLIGPDSWLIEGLRGDKIGAVVAFCTIILCGAVIFFSLRFSLSLLPNLLTGALAEPDNRVNVEYAQKANVWHGVVYFLSFCVPILTGYLLSLLYRGVYRVVKRFALR
jgi:amino acid transporter